MSTFKKAKVILLPTGFIARRKEIGLQAYKTNLRIINNTEEENLIFNQQHLYIISDDEITSKDLLNTNDYYYIRNHYNEWYIGKFNGVSFDFINNDGNFDSNLFVCKKVIATTDSSLEINSNFDYNQLLPNKNNFRFYLPQPSQQFIQKYIEEYNKGNVITDVLVEYQTDFKSETKLYMLGMGDNPDDFEYGEPTVKINPKDNTITIKKVKDSYSREEVDRLLDEQASKTTAEMLEKFKDYKSREEVEKLIYRAIVSVSPNPAKGFIDKWIEENL